jgi:predicted phage-related endonuclease
MKIYPPASPWHAFRRGGITGTDAAAIIGRGFGSPYSVWADKQGYLPPTEESEPMYWGNRLEPVLVEEFGIRSGHEYRMPDTLAIKDGSFQLPAARVLFLEGPPGRHTVDKVVIQNVHDPWARATPDSFFWHQEHGELGILECKTTAFHNADDWVHGAAPMAAQIQLQWNLFVSGLKWGSLVCLIGGQRFVGYLLERNDRFIEYLRGEALKFHTAYVMVPGAKPPPTGPSDLDTVKRMAGPENGQMIQLPEEAADVDGHLQELQSQISMMSADADACRAQIIAWLGENSAGEIPGLGVGYTYHTQERLGTEFRQLRRKETTTQ